MKESSAVVPVECERSMGFEGYVGGLFVHVVEFGKDNEDVKEEGVLFVLVAVGLDDGMYILHS